MELSHHITQVLAQASVISILMLAFYFTPCLVMVQFNNNKCQHFCDISIVPNLWLSIALSKVTCKNSCMCMIDPDDAIKMYKCHQN